jgi:hypothetical protein
VARRWGERTKYAVIAIGVLVIAYYGYVLLSPPIFNTYNYFFPPQLPSEIPISEVLAEFSADPSAAENKYFKRMIVVSGMVRKDDKGRVFFELPGENGKKKELPIHFFDPDEAGENFNAERLMYGMMARAPNGELMMKNASPR